MQHFVKMLEMVCVSPNASVLFSRTEFFCRPSSGYMWFGSTFNYTAQECECFTPLNDVARSIKILSVDQSLDFLGRSENGGEDFFLNPDLYSAYTFGSILDFALE